ncbi:B-box zinc finger protein 22 [Punica granatum]|uniref:B box-type domain-containing protein n=2 Tax=Punica granatum TaxID=22663 RepID=A0A218XUE1_PUNGR|nr:B-box zinc finger protein 22 [Punica granatum]OWM88563.1 hypothetical protein CDL15_Pgr002330 [Punica granatum]PKI54272.1 hypothetical protein CRG98_025332 [Punica granatum]
MKIQCNVCEAVEASVLCCADEAALCWACDEKVHAANKLASKHQRVPLYTSSSQIPKCDICQEAAGFFFCLEDRALLCRKCDVAIHTANVYVSAHRRFLLTGVKVGLDPAEPGPSSSSVNSQSGGKISETKSTSASKGVAQLPLSGDHNGALPMRQDAARNFVSGKVPLSGGSVAGSIQQWNLDDLLGFTEYNHAYSYMDNGSSKADSGKLGDSDCSSMQRTSEEGEDECPGQVPENSWAVPQIPSPPTASGLYWPKTPRHISNGAVSVPDICSLPEHATPFQRGGNALKRRRHS